MKIVADQQIPFVEEAFGRLGDIDLYPGRDITRDHVKDCEVLLVRSVTRINEDLLQESRVRFVASATSGIDHVDTDYLRRKGIVFSHAPGSNARSVAEYVVAALLELSGGWHGLKNKKAGIIGYGHVGSRVARFLDALGVRCVINDPPLAERSHDGLFKSIEEALACDIISLHVPLIVAGDHPTRNLLNRTRLAQVPDGAIIINTARGEVLDETVVLEGCRTGRFNPVIDVWRNEPHINLELLERVAIGTPHIAGYSVDGRLRAADRIYTDCCAFLGETPSYRFNDLSPIEIILPTDRVESVDVINHVIKKAYPVMQDVAALKQLLKIDASGTRASGFDRLRREYPQRREFCAARIVQDELTEEAVRVLEALGFRLCPA